MQFSSLIVAVAALATSLLAQTPPGYPWAHSDRTLFLKYPGFPVFQGGAVLPYAAPTYQPTLYSRFPLNGTYIVFLVDADANKSAVIPSKLLWLDSGVQFSSHINYNPGARDVPLYPAISGNSSRVPYLSPSIPDHTYVAFIYPSPPNFQFPPDFPFNDTVRDNFNVARIAVDFKVPLLAANYFTIWWNATTTATANATGSGGYWPKAT